MMLGTTNIKLKKIVIAICIHSFSIQIYINFNILSGGCIGPLEQMSNYYFLKKSST